MYYTSKNAIANEKKSFSFSNTVPIKVINTPEIYF